MDNIISRESKRLHLDNNLLDSFAAIGTSPTSENDTNHSLLSNFVMKQTKKSTSYLPIHRQSTAFNFVDFAFLHGA